MPRFSLGCRDIISRCSWLSYFAGAVKVRYSDDQMVWTAMIKRSRHGHGQLQVSVAHVRYVPYFALEPCLLVLPYVSLTCFSARERGWARVHTGRSANLQELDFRYLEA